MKSKKSLRIAVVLFTMVFAVGAAFAATNGMLAFGGTVRINTATVGPDPVMSLEFVRVNGVSAPEVFRPYVTATADIIVNNDDRQTLSFDIDIPYAGNIDFAAQSTPGNPVPNNLVTISFTVANTGDTPVRLTRILPQGQTGVSPFHVSLAGLNINPAIGRVFLPGETAVGAISFCRICFYHGTVRNSGLSLYDVDISLNYAFILVYEAVVGDVAPEAGDNLAIDEFSFCELF